MIKSKNSIKDPIEQIKSYLKVPSLSIVAKNAVAKLSMDTLSIVNANGIRLDIENLFFKEHGNFENIPIVFDETNEYYSEKITGFIYVDELFRVSLIIVAGDYKKINLNYLLSKEQSIDLEESIIWAYYEMLIECYDSIRIILASS